MSARSFFVPLVVLLVSFPLPSRAIERIGLFVGSNRGSERDVDLKYSVKDAKRVRDVLVDFGGFSEENTVVLQDPSRATLLETFEDLSGRIRRRVSQDTLFVFYYSGHANESGLKLGEEQFSFDKLKALISRAEAKIAITILDSCRSGIITRSKGVSRGAPFDIRMIQQLSASGEILITSSSEDELSQESDELGGSFFTHHFVNGLRGNADFSGDRAITLGEAYGYAYHQTVSQTADTRTGPQHPVFRINIAGEGDVVLTTIPSGQTALVFPQTARGDFLVWNEKTHNVVAEIHLAGDREHAIALAPGRYVVKQRLPNHMRQTPVQIRQGQATKVQLSSMRQVSFLDDNQNKSSLLEPELAPRDRGLTPLEKSGWSILGVGLAAGITGAVILGVAMDWQRDLENSCTEGVCAKQADFDKIEAGKKLALSEKVLIPTGSVLAATGAALLIVAHSRKKNEQKRAALSFTPTLGRGVVGVSFGGRF